MANIISDVKDYIDNNIAVYSSLLIDYLQANNNELMIRHEPSNVQETRYMDGSRIGMFNFSITAKNLDSKVAIDQLNLITDELDLVDNLELDPTLTFIVVKASTGVRLISKKDKQEFIYSITFGLEYKTRRK